MKTLIVKILLFFVGLFIIAFILDIIISSGLRKTDTVKFQVWNDIFASNIKSDVVIVGSSRAWYQYSPRILDSIVKHDFYNLGIDGRTFNYQLIRYQTYRRFNPKPKYIIQNLDFLTLDHKTDPYLREQYFPFILDDTLMSMVADDNEISWFYRKIPLIRYFGYHDEISDGTAAFFGKRIFSQSGMYKGYRGNEWKWDGENLRNLKNIKYSKNPIVKKLFEDYLVKCKQEGIEVILVSAPIYYKGVEKIIGFEEGSLMYVNFADKYALKLLDYTKDSICYDSSYFCNATHLNKKGSELFSLKLAKDLKKIIR